MTRDFYLISNLKFAVSERKNLGGFSYIVLYEYKYLYRIDYSLLAN